MSVVKDVNLEAMPTSIFLYFSMMMIIMISLLTSNIYFVCVVFLYTVVIRKLFVRYITFNDLICECFSVFIGPREKRYLLFSTGQTRIH